MIVSGLARGIDTAAHMACLKNGGSTIAVIGTGLDAYYPKENAKLQAFIADKHLILTEYPPASKPLAHHFPERNRIISGLSQGVMVVDAKLRSGSLITCERALEQGRDVFCGTWEYFGRLFQWLQSSDSRGGKMRHIRPRYSF